MMFMHGKGTFLTCLFIVWIPFMHAQESSGHHDHHHRHSEISIGTGAVFMPGESWGYGLHLHGTLGITEWMGAGAGFELIAGEHTHYTITGLLHFHPFHPLDINIGPGLVLPDEELPQYRLKTHAEIAAVFEVSEHLHLGPALDLGVGKHDLHLTPGIHIGWIFNIGEEFRGPGDLH